MRCIWVRKLPAAIFAFDLLLLDGRDQRRGLPLLRRWALLERLLKHGERVRYGLGKMARGEIENSVTILGACAD